MRVSYLGPKGSFTQIALIKYFSDDTEQVSKRTIDEVFKSVEIGEADYGVVQALIFMMKFNLESVSVWFQKHQI